MSTTEASQKIIFIIYILCIWVKSKYHTHMIIHDQTWSYRHTYLHYITRHDTRLHSILYIQPFSEETYVFDIIHLFCHNVRSVCNLPIPFAVRPHSVYSPLISLQHAYALNSRSFSPELSNQPTRKYGNFRLMVKQSSYLFSGSWMEHHGSTICTG